MSDNKQIIANIAFWILKNSFNSNYNDNYVGDCEEMFNELLNSKGRMSANIWIWKQALRSFFPFIGISIVQNFRLLGSNLKISYRHLLKEKFHSIVNIWGLSLGLASFILMMGILNFEYSFDNFHKDIDRIYRINQLVITDNGEIEQSETPMPIGPLLAQKFPEIQNFARIYHEKNAALEINNMPVFENAFVFSDSSFFTIFNFEFLEKSISNPLAIPNSIVITEEAKIKYFGDKDPIGEIVTLNQKWANRPFKFVIRGIVKSPPKNSHIKFNFIASIHDFVQAFGMNSLKSSPIKDPIWFWQWRSTNTYIKLHENVNINNLSSKYVPFIEEYYPDLDDRNWSFSLTSLKNIHLNDTGNLSLSSNSTKSSLYIIFVLTVMLLFVAVINSMNLSITRSIKRSKEVGLRKVLGSTRKLIITQFLTESILMSFISILAALILIIIAIPEVNVFLNRSFEISDYINYKTLVFLFTLGIMTGLFSGFYPAFIVSGFKPAKAIKNDKSGESNSYNFQNSLIILQFVITTILISSTILIKEQVSYIHNKDLGFDKKNIILLDLSSNIAGKNIKKFNNFKSNLINDQNIKSVTELSYNAVIGNRAHKILLIPQGTTTNYGEDIRYLPTDRNFLKVFDIKLKTGKELFDKKFGSISYFINESAAKIMGMDAPIGKTIRSSAGGSTWNGVINGIVEDFHFAKLTDKIEPFIIGIHTTPFPGFGYVAVKLNDDAKKSSMQGIEKIWNNYYPNRPFEPFYLEDNLNNLYADTDKFLKLITVLTILVIFLAGLGAFALISYAVEMKTKEIGIRKVFGAVRNDIVFILCRGITLQVLLSGIISYPIIYFLSKNWLEKFAYRIEVSSEYFLYSTLALLIIISISVGAKAIKAGNIQPVKYIRQE